MKTIDKAAKEYLYNTDTNSYLECFKSGVEFAQRWIPVEEELPEVIDFSKGFIENDDLLILKCSKYDSLEFGVLRELNGKKYWEVPDVGSFKISEITHWRAVEFK